MNCVSVFMCLYCLVKICYSQEQLFEGSSCSDDGSKGVCKNIKNCDSALKLIRQGVHPQTCCFSGDDPIVCCLDNDATTEPVISTDFTFGISSVTSAPPDPAPSTATTLPQFGLIGKNGEREEARIALPEPVGCPPIDANKTALKTGQKAWDKCIEYQHRLVFPCEKNRRFDDCPHSLNTYIIGGEDVYEWEFPHMALVGYGSDPQVLSFQCGGSLISESFVLTAGHCASARDLGPITYVLLGVLKRSSFDRSNLHKVSAVHKHPMYYPPKKYNDIALLQMETPITLTNQLIPACLDVGNVWDAEKAIATGWGAVQFRGANSDIMQKVELTKYPEAECASRFPPSRLMITGLASESQICYGDRTLAKDTCQGDSGGPLQVQTKIYCMYTVIGVTSFGRACGVPGEPALYTRVSHYLPWIEGLVWPDAQ